jgi:RNA polymerase sigma factor (sigma-70 family)
MIDEAVRVATRVLDDRAAAEDAAVQALALAHLRWTKLREDPSRQAWVLRVTINAALDIQRSEHRRRNRENRSRAAAVGSSFEGASVDRLVMSEALRRLPRRQREAVALRYLADLSEKHAAEAMGISVGSVKVHVRRALSALGNPVAREITGGQCDVDA